MGTHPRSNRKKSQNEGSSHDVFVKNVLEQILSSLELKKKVPLHVSWSLVGSRQSARLNRDYLHRDYATDVLSFPSPKVFQRQGLLGELVICLPVAKRQAKEVGHSLESELTVLLVHGVLHLLGFDHESSPMEARRMARMELKILSHPKLKKGSQSNPESLIARVNSKKLVTAKVGRESALLKPKARGRKIK